MLQNEAFKNKFDLLLIYVCYIMKGSAIKS